MKSIFIFLLIIESGLLMAKPIDEVNIYFKLLTDKSERTWKVDEVNSELNTYNNTTFTFYANNVVKILDENGEDSYKFILENNNNKILLKFKGKEFFILDISRTDKCQGDRYCLRLSELNLNQSRKMSHIYIYTLK